jgi:hypothetical protein
VKGRRLKRLTNQTPPRHGTLENKGKWPGNSPSPSSLHPGIVNVPFCDGRVRALSENINQTVYAGLVTFRGARSGQGVLDDNQY